MQGYNQILIKVEHLHAACLSPETEIQCTFLCSSVITWIRMWYLYAAKLSPKIEYVGGSSMITFSSCITTAERRAFRGDSFIKFISVSLLSTPDKVLFSSHMKWYFLILFEFTQIHRCISIIISVYIIVIDIVGRQI